MGVTFGFYNSKNGDRVYDATQMSTLFNGIIRDGVFANYPAQNQHLTVEAGSAVNNHPTVNIGPGRAWFNGTWTDNSASLSLTLPSADNIADRYDAIILEINTTNDADNTVSPAVPGRSNGFRVISGSPGGSYPAISNSTGIYRYALAYVKVAHGATTVSSIDYKVGTTVPYIVNAVQETWSANDVIARWNSEWAAYLAGLDTSWASYLSEKDSAWNTFISGKNSAWSTYIDDKDDAWDAYIESLRDELPQQYIVEFEIRDSNTQQFSDIDDPFELESAVVGCNRSLASIQAAYRDGEDIKVEVALEYITEVDPNDFNNQDTYANRDVYYPRYRLHFRDVSPNDPETLVSIDAYFEYYVQTNIDRYDIYTIRVWLDSTGTHINVIKHNQIYPT